MTNSWRKRKTTATRTKKSGNQIYFPINIPNNQKPIPVIQTSNRFNVLHNLQAAQIETSRTLKRNPEIYRSKDQTLKKKAVNRVTRVKPSKKITLIGDSHTRGLATELRNLMGREYFISSTFMPGAGLQSMTKLAKSEIAALTRSNTVIVCGGSNDASKNESQTGLNCLNNFTNLKTNTNIMIISIPQRHDLSSKSCVNKEILAFNRKLHKIMKNKESVKILDCNISREGYTRHGQHHNPKGKAMLARQIVQELTKQTEDNTINPIPMAWKKSPTDPTPKESATGPTTRASKEWEKPSTVPIPSECESADIKKVIRQTNSATSAISEASVNESSDPNNRLSIRRKEIPLTRGNDFLWG